MAQEGAKTRSLLSPVSQLSSQGHFLSVAEEVHSLLPQAPIFFSLSTQLAESQRVLNAHFCVGQQHCWASKILPGHHDVPHGTAWILALRFWACTITVQEVMVSISNPSPEHPLSHWSPQGSLPASFPISKCSTLMQ